MTAESGALVVSRVDGSDRKELTKPVTPSSPAWSPDGGQIAFVSGSGGSSEVHVIRSDGRGERRLASAPATGPLEWAPDGKGLLAGILTPGGESGDPTPSKIALLSLGERHPRTIAEGRDAAWSPDGSRVAFVRDRWQIMGRRKGAVGVPTLASVRRDGTGLQPLFRSRSGAVGTRFGSPVWTPDGLSVLIPESEDIVGGEERVRQVPADGGRGRVIARGGPSGYDALTVSPDGKLVAFATGKGIEIVSLASGERTAVIHIGEHVVDALAWSPDGKELGYLASPETAASSLYVVKPNGAEQRMISKPGESVDSFAWRPEPPRA
jgi:TolB protein